MYCVGLTGNITSGKSTAIRYFQSLGVPVIIADDVARELTIPGQPTVELIKQHFGGTIVNAYGELNRAALRQIIVKDAKQRRWLENLLHPLIRQKIEQKANQFAAAYCVIEIPLLLKRSDYPYLNRVLAILADDEILVKRVMQRDQCTKQQAQAILAIQPTNAERRQIADDVLLNQGSVQDLQREIDRLHEQYLLAAQQFQPPE